MNIIWLNNLREKLTGTTISSKHCIDVNVANVSAIPVDTSGGLDTLETRFHDISSANINNSGGAFIALGDGSALASDIRKLQLSYTAGEPLEIGIGANAGAAARKAVINQGEGPSIIDAALTTGDKLWIRSLSGNSVTAGYITLNLLG